MRRNRANVTEMSQPSPRTKLRRALRQKRALVVALLAVGALVALLNGIGGATFGHWGFGIFGDQPLSTLTPRFGAATTFDKTNSEPLVFGGFSGVQLPGGEPRPPTLGDTYGYNNSTNSWINRNPIHTPSPRGYASMVYDDARGNVVLFGGGTKYNDNTAVSDETWTWNGSDWSLANPPEPRPAARQNHVMVYDAHRKVVVMFGGKGAPDSSNSQGALLDDTWTWDGSVWKKSLPSTSPLPRHSAAMAYDVCRGEAVLFGGDGPSVNNPLFGGGSTASFFPASGETWTWNGATWTQRNPLPAPPPRIGASMVYSNLTGRVLLYGGFSITDTGTKASLVATDTSVWAWNGTGWQKDDIPDPVLVAVALQGPFVLGVPPLPRAYASVVTRSGEGGFWVFGGTPAPPAFVGGQVALSDQRFYGEGGLFEAVDGEDIIRRVTGAPALGLVPKCYNPVPIPADETPVAQSGGASRRVENRDEIKEVNRLPVLLGTDPKTVPEGAPAPDCPRTLNMFDGEVRQTRLVTDPQRNKVYQFFNCRTPNQGDAPFQRKILIQAYDGKTLKPLGSALAPMTSQFHGPQVGNVLHDAAGGRFFIRWTTEHIGTDLYVIQQDLIEKGVNPVVDKISGTWSDNMGVFTHPKTGRAKLLISGSSGNNVAQFDIDGKSPDWSTTLAACSGTPKGGMRTKDYVYTSCSTTTGGKWGVVRIPIVEDLAAASGEKAGTPEVFPGAIYGDQSHVRTWSDPQAERVLLQITAPYFTTLWVFDGKVSRWVGRVGLASRGTTEGSVSGSAALDQETGRLYMLVSDHKTSTFGGAAKEQAVQGGLRVVETRLTPVPQAVNIGQFSYTSEAEIGILPPGEGLPRRLFVRRAKGSTPLQYPGHPDYPAQSKAYADPVYRYVDGEVVKLPDEMHYLVLADELPVPEQPDLSQLDALTVPVAETPSKTEVTFDAEASGYGIRLRSVGGIMSILRPPAQAQSTFDLFAGSQGPPVTCFGPDRELLAGWVNRVHLSDLETSASSSGLEVDSSSKTDLEGVTSRCQPSAAKPEALPPQSRPVYHILWPLLPFAQVDNTAGFGSLQIGDNKINAPTGLAWNKHFTVVECAGDSTETNQATVTVVDVYGSATCNQTQAKAEGIARGNLGAAPANAVYSVGEGYSEVVVAREPARGIVVTSTAVATGIKLQGISIGLVKTEAVTWSNGRPAEKRASFTRTICRVSPPPNNHPEACLDQAGQKKMADDFNARSGVNGKMLLPTPDPEYLKGSPGGYIAGVTKVLSEEVENQFFTLESQKEVPGLVIEFYKDSPTQGFGRQILELAGVRGITGFGVQCGPDYVYSASAKNCLLLTFEDDPVEFEAEVEDEGEFSEDDTEFDSGGVWTPLDETGPPEGLALGKRLGRFIENLPVVRLLPLRQIGEAFLAGAVWYLLGLPLFFASRRFALNLARRS